MATDEGKITDEVFAALEEQGPPEPVASEPLPTAPMSASPVSTARDATIAQTGADPPPPNSRQPFPSNFPRCL